MCSISLAHFKNPDDVFCLTDLIFCSRAFKDLITFIPFVIILLIPLSPVGHVMVFGAIQRFYPDFFPSCFTEQRQNLLQLYETAEYTEFSIDENWREKLSRLTAAFFYFIASTSRSLFQRLTASGPKTIDAEVQAKRDLGDGKTKTGARD